MLSVKMVAISFPPRVFPTDACCAGKYLVSRVFISVRASSLNSCRCYGLLFLLPKGWMPLRLPVLRVLVCGCRSNYHCVVEFLGCPVCMMVIYADQAQRWDPSPKPSKYPM